MIIKLALCIPDIFYKCMYRKCVISSRGYYYFQASWGAGNNQERLLFKSGYYKEFCIFTLQNVLKITWNRNILIILLSKMSYME